MGQRCRAVLENKAAMPWWRRHHPGAARHPSTEGNWRGVRVKIPLRGGVDAEGGRGGKGRPAKPLTYSKLHNPSP